jgi:hypothetical protein
MRMNVPDLIFFIIMLLISIICIYGLLDTKNNNHLISIQYDCRLAEISPDFPQQVKQQCRLLNKR